MPARGALEIIEEAVHLLCRISASHLAHYYVGTLPFVLGFLYFWADMSRSAFAEQHCVQAAVGLSGLFLWMKYWHAVFVQGLKEEICGIPKKSWSWNRVLRIVKTQTMIQPLGLFLLPLALLVTIPFGWVYAFFQNGLMEGGDDDDWRSICKKSLRQASLWPVQNHILLSIMFLFGWFVFFNLTIALWYLPHLVNMLLGMDTVFTRMGEHLLNTTFFVIVFGLTFLCVDPLVKACYALRCFYGESLTTGEDLRMTVRMFGERNRVLASLLIALALGLASIVGNSTSAQAEEVGVQEVVRPLHANAVGAKELDLSIGEILSHREYRWRIPRGADDSEDGPVKSFVGEILGWIGKIFSSLWDLVVKFVQWIRSLFPERTASYQDGEKSIFNWMNLTRALVLFLLATVVCSLGIFLWRFWRRSNQRPVDTNLNVVSPEPDVADEEVTANQLPSQEWAAMARELMDKGELRLALRALYLATLAYLGERDMISIAKFKSDREYERDLRRRIHVKPDLLKAFRHNLLVFQRAWYGKHDSSQMDFQACFANLERMKISV